MRTTKEICEISYRIEYKDAEGKPGSVFRTFRAEDGFWSTAHEMVDQFVEKLESEGKDITAIHHVNSVTSRIPID
jgi:hypothetical protein